MGFKEMAHSHVQRLLREGMELDEVMQDCDGDYPFRHGSAAYFLSVSPTGHMVKIWSRAVSGVTTRAAVLREVNELNGQLLHSRAYVKDSALMIEAVLAVEELTKDHLVAVCFEVGGASDAVGPMVATVHGGCVWFEDDEVEESA